MGDPDEKALSDGPGSPCSRTWIILSMARGRDLPGRRYFFTMGSERECEVCSSEFFVAIRVT